MTKNQINKQLIDNAFGFPSRRLRSLEKIYLFCFGHELPWIDGHITEREIHLRQALRHEGISDAKGMNRPLGSWKKMTLKNKPKTKELVANLRGRGFNYAANLIENRHYLIDSDEVTEQFDWSKVHPGHNFWNYVSAKLNEQWESGDPVTYYPLNWDWVKNA